MPVNSRAALPPLDALQRYSLAEAAAYLRSSKNTLSQDVLHGRIATIQEGRRRFVPGSELIRRSRVTAAA